MAGAAYSDNLCRFFSLTLEHVIELNMTSLPFHRDLDPMKLLPKETLKCQHPLSMSLCVLGCQFAAHHLLTACSDLRELDVRINRGRGELIVPRLRVCSPPKGRQITTKWCDVSSSHWCRQADGARRSRARPAVARRVLPGGGEGAARRRAWRDPESILRLHRRPICRNTTI
ncbi:hypothetical protein HPB51_028151 [Rhipicephalus microplus]|uniref:Uncharacterized protein n=1 Tax=Rhipicephalus microplus TaxID=6941 RepID=A0A9J6CYL1_RHIMP|nr:hypothetical protein HPB51_028151 [Rhipicephalus microplus]